jgi:hypothetical protein
MGGGGAQSECVGERKDRRKKNRKAAKKERRKEGREGEGKEEGREGEGRRKKGGKEERTKEGRKEGKMKAVSSSVFHSNLKCVADSLSEHRASNAHQILQQPLPGDIGPIDRSTNRG